MTSGQLRDMIRRVYDVSNDQAQGMMNILETISDNMHKTYMKGVRDGYRSFIDEKCTTCEKCIYFLSPYPNSIDADGLCTNCDKLTDKDSFCSDGVKKDADKH